MLPPGWIQANDPQTGRIYYCNPTTKETQWDPPSTSTRVPTPPAPSSTRSVASSSKSNTPHAHHHNSNPDLLVPLVRNLFDQVAAFPEQTAATDLELNGISPGQIADLCHMKQADTHGANEAYTPLNPYTMSVLRRPPETEQARLDVRLYELREKLNQL